MVRDVVAEYPMCWVIRPCLNSARPGRRALSYVILWHEGKFRIQAVYSAI
jgi:hypothetical protein